jgi:hypothetical protein
LPLRCAFFLPPAAAFATFAVFLDAAALAILNAKDESVCARVGEREIVNINLIDMTRKTGFGSPPSAITPLPRDSGHKTGTVR